MSIKTSLIINIATFSLPVGKIGEATYWNGSLQSVDIYTDGTARSIFDWALYVGRGGNLSSFVWKTDIVNNEYIRFYYYGDDEPRSLKITNQTLANALGMPYNVSVVADSTDFHNIYATKWGNKRLVVSGSANSKNNHISTLKTFPFEALEFANDVVHFNNKDSVSNYDKSQDKKRYVGISNWVGEEHIEEIRDFMYECKFGATITLHNISRPSNSVNWKFDLSPYKGFKQDEDKFEHREIGYFSFGVMEL